MSTDNPSPRIPDPTPEQAAQRDALAAFNTNRIYGRPASYPPLDEIQALIDSGDTDAAAARAERMHVEELAYPQYEGKWTRPALIVSGGVTYTDRWFIATVVKPLTRKADPLRLSVLSHKGARVLARAERQIDGDVRGYTVFDHHDATNLANVDPRSLDRSAEPNPTS